MSSSKSKKKSSRRQAGPSLCGSGNGSARIAQNDTRTALLLAACALVLLVIAAYANSLGNGFVWDDHQQILNNPAVQAGAPLGRILSSDVRFDTHTQGVQSSDYRPLQMLAYRLLMGSFGANAVAFHACSLVLAVACTLAAFLVFWLLTREWRTSFAAGTLFALLPVHAEAVDWIAALPELGFSLCVLLAFACFLQDQRRASTIASKRYSLFAVLSWLLFAAALLWKETAIVYPLLIVVYVLLTDSTAAALRFRAAFLASVPYFVIAAGYLTLRFAVLGSVASAPRDWDLTLAQKAINIAALMEMYWAKLAWPFRLNAYYTFHPLRSFAAPGTIVTILVAVVAVAVLAALLRDLFRRSRAAAQGARVQQVRTLPLCLFAVCWTCITLLPVMDLAALGRNPFTERYLYLPSVGFCLLITLLARELLRLILEAPQAPQPFRRYAGPMLLAIVAGLFFYVTVQRNSVWKDDAVLFRTTLFASPDAPFVHNMVATADGSDPAQADDAAGNYTEALNLALKQTPPDHVDAVVALRGLAWIDGSRGQLQQALAMLDRANNIAPQDADTDGERGLLLAQDGRGQQALPYLERAMAAEPNNENVLSALGIIANEEGHDPQRAVGYFQQALAMHRSDDDFAASQHNNLATVYAEINNYPAATEQLQTAIRLLPSDPTFHANLANALAAQGRFAEAQQEAQTAVQLAPQVPAFAELLQKIEQANAGH